MKIIILITLIVMIATPVAAAPFAVDLYSIGDGRHIAVAQNPTDYITPDNPTVQSYADTLYLDDAGELRYIDNGTLMQLTYMLDRIQFPESRLTRWEHWIQADAYILNGRVGDCDDSAIAVTSMMRSGNLSVINNGEFVQTYINATTRIGLYYSNNKSKWVNHAWVEYDNEIYSFGGGYNSSAFITKFIVTEKEFIRIV